MPSKVSQMFLNSWQPGRLRWLGRPSGPHASSALLVDTQGPKEDTKRAKQDASLEETRFKLVMFQPHVAVDVLNQSSLAERRMIPLVGRPNAASSGINLSIPASEVFMC